MLDIGRYLRLKADLEAELFTLIEYLRLDVQRRLPGEMYDSYFHPDSERLRVKFLECIVKQFNILKPHQKAVATFRPLLQDVIFQERISSQGLKSLRDSQDFFPLSWSDYCGLNWDIYEHYILDKEIVVYCAFPFLTVLSMFLYLKECRGYRLKIRYHLTTMEGIKKIQQRLEKVDVFVASDIQAAAALNNPRRYADGVPVMLLPPGELPTMVYPFSGYKGKIKSGIYVAQNGTSAQADIFRRIKSGQLPLKRIRIETAEKDEYRRILRANPEEVRIVSWEPLGSVFIDYLEPKVKIVTRSQLHYILFFTKEFICRDRKCALALVLALINAWYILTSKPELAVDLLMSDEHVLTGFARLYLATKDIA
jgi:hypothetical protein